MNIKRHCAVLVILIIAGFWLSPIVASCPRTMSDRSAIHIARHAMNTWLSAVQKGQLSIVSQVLAPHFIIVHTRGTPMTKMQELQLTKGFHLGGYRFSHFCAMQLGDTIIAIFALKTRGKISHRVIGIF